MSSRATAEQEFREAYLNCKLARQWGGGAAPWANVDFAGVELTASTAEQHTAAYDQARRFSLFLPGVLSDALG